MFVFAVDEEDFCERPRYGGGRYWEKKDVVKSDVKSVSDVVRRGTIV